MVTKKNKALCSGCGACANACSHNALLMKTDRNGFRYPFVDKKKCTGCNICESVCPIYKTIPIPPEQPLVIAAINKNWDIRRKSSSGGAFYELARYVIERGGVVFGVRFDGLHVIHDCADTMRGVEAFMGSKYIQSDTRHTFKEVRSYLNSNRFVLFSGTPCQIAGLKRYLRGDNVLLITVDIICHGVPSPGIWEKYMGQRMRKIEAEEIRDISFRNKDFGMFVFFFFFFLGKDNNWHEIREKIGDNAYCSLFLKHIFRPSCYNCQYRTLDSYSDFTIGDCWNSPEDHACLYDDKGVSTLILHTNKAKQIFEEVKNRFKYENENPLIMTNRYREYITETELDKRKKQWKLFYIIQPWMSLERAKIIWGHDKPHYVLKRKINKCVKWKRNTK